MKNLMLEDTGTPRSDQDIITHQFHNKQLASALDSYAKTQAYMQCGTMLVKNLVGHVGVHNKTCHAMNMSGHSH